MRKAIENLDPYNEKDHLNVIIETPKGSLGKFKFDEKIGLFRMDKLLPVGMVFPHDFGFIPGTHAEDGDPLDVLVLTEAIVFPGCVVNAREVGIIEAEQTEEGETIRNDRVVAVEINSRDYEEMKAVDDLGKRMMDEIEAFFVQYNKLQGRKFKIIGLKSARHAGQLIEQSMRAARKS
jgi:inorganic pyrophosphatase